MQIAATRAILILIALFYAGSCMQASAPPSYVEGKYIYHDKCLACHETYEDSEIGRYSIKYFCSKDSIYLYNVMHKKSFYLYHKPYVNSLTEHQVKSIILYVRGY